MKVDRHLVTALGNVHSIGILENRVYPENRAYPESRMAPERRTWRSTRDNRDMRDGYVPRGRQEYRQPRERIERERDPGVDNRNGVTLADLEVKSVDELQEMAKELDISGFSRLKKQELAFRILQAQTEQQGNIFKRGILDIMEDGFGFLRLAGYLPSQDDVYVSQSQIRRFGLRTGDEVVGQVRPPKESEKYFSLLSVEAVNGQDSETAKRRPHFSDLTPVFQPERAGDVRHSLADLAHVRQSLGYEPVVSFEAGLRATMDWYATILT